MTDETSKITESQLNKFKEAARDLECDEDEKRFADKVGKLVKPTPVGDKPSK